MTKGLAAFLLCASLLTMAACLDARALELPKLSVSAKACALYDPWLGQMVFEKNADARLGMASTTKIMTAALALELYDRETVVTIRPEWCGVEGSSMYLRAGEQLRVDDLLWGLMLMSGNDAALALASLQTGDPDDFVALMNARAAELGLADTAFENPSGLDGPGHFSSARDMAVLAAWAMENPVFAHIVSTATAERAGRYMKNHNRLVRTLPGCVGVKTGYTKASGRCLVSAFTHEGRTLIAVTLDAPDDWRDHTALYAQAFADVTPRALVEPGIVGVAYLANGQTGWADLTVVQGFSAALSGREAERVQIVLCGPRIWYGPAVAGARWGELQIRLDGQIIGRQAVCFVQDVAEKAPVPGFFARIWRVIFGALGGD